MNKTTSTCTQSTVVMPATGTYATQGLLAASLGFKAGENAKPARTMLTRTTFLSPSQCSCQDCWQGYPVIPGEDVAQKCFSIFTKSTKKFTILRVKFPNIRKTKFPNIPWKKHKPRSYPASLNSVQQRRELQGNRVKVF